MAPLNNVMTFNCTAEPDLSIEQCTTLISPMDSYTCKTQKFNNVITISAEYAIIIPANASMLMIHTSRAYNETTASVNLYYSFDTFMDLGGMLGPLIARTDDDLLYCVVLCASTRVYKYIDLSALAKQPFPDHVIDPTMTGHIYIARTGAYSYDTDGAQFSLTANISDTAASALWKSINDTVTVNHLMLPATIESIPIQTIDDCSLTKIAADCSTNILNIVYTPKPDPGKVHYYYPIIGATVVVTTMPNFQIMTESEFTHVIPKSVDNTPANIAPVKPRFSGIPQKIFTKIASVRDSRFMKVFVPGRSNAIVFLTRPTVTDTQQRTYSVLQFNMTETNQPDAEKYSDVATISYRPIVDSDQSAMTYLFFAPRCATEIMVIKVPFEEETMILPSAISFLQLPAPPASPTVSAGARAMDRGHLFSTATAVQSTVSSKKLIVFFVPDRAPEFLQIQQQLYQDVANNRWTLQWVYADAFRKTSLNAIMPDTQLSKFTTLMQNRMVRDNLGGLSVNHLYEALGGNFPTMVKIAICENPAENVNLDMFLISGYITTDAPPVLEFTKNPRPVCGIIDSKTNDRIYIPSYGNTFFTSNNIYVIDEAAFCEQVDFNHEMCQARVVAILGSQIDIAGVSDKWRTVFVNTVKNIDMDRTRSFTLDTVLGDLEKYALNTTKNVVADLAQTLSLIPDNVQAQPLGVLSWGGSGGSALYEAARDHCPLSRAIIDQAINGDGDKNPGWCKKRMQTLYPCQTYDPDNPEQCNDRWSDDAFKKWRASVYSNPEIKQTLDLCACYTNNIAWTAVLNDYLSFCNNNIACEDMLRGKVAPKCDSKPCQIGPFAEPRAQPCDGNITINNCVINVEDGVTGDIECNLCDTIGYNCDGGGGGGGGGGFAGLSTTVWIVLGVTTVVLIIVLVLILRKTSTPIAL